MGGYWANTSIYPMGNYLVNGLIAQGNSGGIYGSFVFVKNNFFRGNNPETLFSVDYCKLFFKPIPLTRIFLNLQP
jgi:hypothetical protein